MDYQKLEEFRMKKSSLEKMSKKDDTSLSHFLRRFKTVKMIKIICHQDSKIYSVCVSQI